MNVSDQENCARSSPIYESLGQRTFHQITIENLLLIQEEYLNTTHLKWSLVGDLANIRHFFGFYLNVYMMLHVL